MLISFIISSYSREDRILTTISSLKAQNNNDYELIIINDDPNVDQEIIDSLYNQFETNENIKLVFNSKSQGAAANWDTGMQLATGDYITFIKEGDILDDEFISTIQKAVVDNKKVDIIQYKQNWTGLIEGVTKTLLKDNKVYDLTKDKEVYAFINQNVYGKLFRTKYIKEFRISFRRYLRYDTLFLYKALGHARTFLQVQKPLSLHRMGVLKYSAFDLVNQWPHILNYYRRIGTYKELSDELNYAYVHELAYDFLKLVKKFENKQLYRKALRYSEMKMMDKLKSFTTKNKIFLESKDKDFVEHINNFKKFITTELKHVRR